MTKSRFIFTRVMGDPELPGYIVRARRTGLILGNVWRTPWGWFPYGSKRSFMAYPTRLKAAKAL